MTGSDFSNPAILWGDDNNMDSKPDSTQRKILLLGSGSVHRTSVSEGNQIQQGLGRDEVEKKNRQKQKKKKKEYPKHWEQGWDAKYRDKRGTGNGQVKHRDYIYTHRGNR